MIVVSTPSLVATVGEEYTYRLEVAGVETPAPEAPIDDTSALEAPDEAAVTTQASEDAVTGEAPAASTEEIVAEATAEEETASRGSRD